MMYCDYVNTPLGIMEIKASDQGLRHAIFCGDKKEPVHACSLIDFVKVQIQAYFSGRLQQFDVILDPVGTEFQRSVWQVLDGIPYGETRSYLQVAERIQKTNAVRAVGGAVGRNPLTIFTPCHRVIGSKGLLTGFAGGLERKQWLLAHEGGMANLTKPHITVSVKHARQAKTEFLF